MGSFANCKEALGPLRVRAQQLQLQASKEHDAALQRWEQSEKPVLKEHAAGLKETMQLLAREEAALEQRVAGLSASTVRNHPGTSTGFNVIRARVDSFGRPLTTDALRTERDRLMHTIDKFEVEIAGAKAEITQHRRSEEVEIWETKLVALQDTKRVYREEINLIEVELLGREHYERMQQDRQHAEETGTAQLRRLQENMLQTRIKFNRAKRQHYFPHHEGFNITFGGGGIYGACKDICISEINGSLKLNAEPGGLGDDGVYRPARMIVTFEASGGGGAGGPAGTKSPARKTSTGNGTNANARPSSAPAPVPRSAVPPPRQDANPTPPKGSPSKQTPQGAAAAEAHMQRLSIDQQDVSGARRTVSFPTASSVSGAARPAPAGGSSTATQPHLAPLPPRPAGIPQPQQLHPSPRQATLNPAPSPSPFNPDGKSTKGKGFASRFLNRLGSKKERFQGRELPHLQPARDEDDMMGNVQQRRSLASKLLSRRSTKTSSTRGSDAGLERLAFGGNHLTGRMPSVGAGSVDDNASVAHPGDLSDLEDEGRLDAAQQGFGSRVIEHNEGDGSLASDDEGSEYSGDTRGSKEDHSEPLPSPLTREALQRAHSRDTDAAAAAAAAAGAGASAAPFAAASRTTGSWAAQSSSGRGSWLRNGMGGGGGGGGNDAASAFEDAASSVLELGDLDDGEGGAGGGSSGDAPRGVFCLGRLTGFELIGERGSKVPNLTIGNADVSATVFVRFVFEYDKVAGWQPGTQPSDRPKFHVEKLRYSISGNNVPMPPTLIKHILRVAIPGLIQRRLLTLLPKEFGEYMQTVQRGFRVDADVAVVGPSLEVLDADLGFEVKGPAKSAKEARKQQALYAAAKEARGLLGLSLPQAQLLAELFNGSAALLDPPRPASISQLIAFQATYERHPKQFRQLCQVIDTAYHVLAQAQGRPDVADFAFADFLAGPVARMRRKPARARVIVRDLDVAVNADAVVTAIHDFTQRAIEEMIIKGPLTDPGATLESMRDTVAEELEVLHAWHAFALRELQHFKSKFRGAAGTVLTAADRAGFSAGVENFYYEGPLRLRLPMAIQLDQDGAVSFELPLPSPAGKLGVFMDNFKGLTVPSHLRGPAQAVNWVDLVEDTEVNKRMQEQVATALGLIEDVLAELGSKIELNGLEADDEDPTNALSQPRTTVGDRLGRLIVNRLKVRVRLDERRIGEILSGIDGTSMGGQDAFTATAGRIIGHLGDVMTLGFTPAGGDPSAPALSAAGLPAAPDRYLLHFESSDISRLRADVQSLGFQGAITPGGAVRLVHALVRAAMLAFLERPPEELLAYRERMEGWYRLMTREALNVSMCVDTKGEVEGGKFVVTLSGRADEAALRATSPMVMTNEIDLVPLGKAMRGDPPEPKGEGAPPRI